MSQFGSLNGRMVGVFLSTLGLDFQIPHCTLGASFLCWIWPFAGLFSGRLLHRGQNVGLHCIMRVNIEMDSVVYKAT